MIKVEPIVNISKLVDACSQCSQLFRVGAATVADPGFRHSADRIRHKLDQFAFELQTESRRLGGGEFGPSRYEPIPDDADILTLRCEISLQLVLDQYQQTLNASNLPAHARAMIKRQYFDLQTLYESVVALRRAA